MQVMASRSPTPLRLLSLAALGNLGGAVLSFVYFHEVDPSTSRGAAAIGGGELVFFVLGFALLSTAFRIASARWMQPLKDTAGAPQPGAAGDTARRRALLTPAYFALMSFVGWLAAGFVWGVLWPLLAGGFALENALRQVFGYCSSACCLWRFSRSRR